MASLADRLNILMAQRMRVLFSHSSTDVNNASTGNLVAYRAVFRTGPCTTSVRTHFVILPTSTAPVAVPFIQLILYDSATGASTSVAQAAQYVSARGSTANFNDLFDVEQEFSVGPQQAYHIEIRLSDPVRLVSACVFEVSVTSLDTATTPTAVDPSPFVAGGPITDASIASIINAADKIWKYGHQLGAWTADLPGDEVTTTSATAANWSLGGAAATATTIGFQVNVPYSGTLDDASVPTVFWCYAGYSGAGAGTVDFRDQANNVLATIAVAGGPTWYAVNASVKDASGTPQTTKVDIFVKSDGANALKLYAAGFYMGSNADILNVPPLSWLPKNPRYIGYTFEVITSQ
jgi:hypothetical protein